MNNNIKIQSNPFDCPFTENTITNLGYDFSVETPNGKVSVKCNVHLFVSEDDLFDEVYQPISLKIELPKNDKYYSLVKETVNEKARKRFGITF